MINKWQINIPDENAVRELVLRGLTVPAARALVSGGINTVEKAQEFFGNTEDSDPDSVLSDPFLIRDMDKACELLDSAINDGELICVYGDYDCDGVTASAALSGYLRNIGGNVITHINERSQGFGMNCDVVRELHEKGVQLIVTVDNGIAAVNEAKLCRELGMKLVITDHHQPGEELPEADAVVDPHRSDCPSPFKELCGCGVALKLIAAMNGGDMGFAMEGYSDLAAIATIADVVPLTGENREIVKYGLHYLENTENLGLKALIEKASLKTPFTSTSVAFGIAPRINAAGRVGSPMDAYALLAETEDNEDEAMLLAEKTEALNVQRKTIETHVMDEITALVMSDPSLIEKRVCVFCGKDWHHGVVGIAAARCTERFGRPAFLLSEEITADGKVMYRGSARSIEGFNVFKALSYCDRVLEKYGGHSGAGGFSLAAEKLPEFDRLLQEFADISAAENGTARQVIKVSGQITPAELTVEAVEGLSVLEPFGEGNPPPVFLIADCVITDIIALKGGIHTKLMLSCPTGSIAGLMWGISTEHFPYRKGDAVNILASLSITVFNGNKSVSVRITDIRRKGLNQTRLMAAEDAYYSFRTGKAPDARAAVSMIPERADLAAVYKSMSPVPASVNAVFEKAASERINYCRFLICLDIFEESGLIAYNRCTGTVNIIPDAPKADTSAAPTYKRLTAGR